MVIDFGSAYARKPEPRDIPQIYAYRNDPQVYSSLGGHFTGLSEEDIARWIDKHRTNRDDLVWVVASAQDDACIGHCGLYSIDYRAGRAEIGIAIAGSHWGMGLGGRISAGLTDYGFRQLRLHRVETRVLEANEKVIRYKEQQGYRREGVLRDFQFRDGRHHNVVVMAVLASEWQGIPPKYLPASLPRSDPSGDGAAVNRPGR